jgi:hypothetical protein
MGTRPKGLTWTYPSTSRRVSAGQQLHRAFEIGKEYGHLLALAFQGNARCANLLS